MSTLVGLGLAAPATADQPVVYQAEYSWEQEATRDSCALRREFTHGDEAILLEWRQYFPSNILRTAVLGQGLVHGTGKADIRLLPDSGSLKSGIMFRLDTGGNAAGVLFNLPLRLSPTDGPETGHTSNTEGQPRTVEDREWLAQVSALFLGGVFTRDIQLETGSIDGPMAWMEECTANLVRGWGLDPEVQQRLQRRPVLTNLKLVINRLSEGLRSKVVHGQIEEGRSGGVHFRVLVDEKGVASDCLVEPPTTEALEEIACMAFLRNAKFQPALDESGRPVASFFANTITFIAP